MKKKTKASGVEMQLLLDIKEELRALDYGWVAKLEAQILADNEIEEEFRKNINTTKLYNVFNGIVTNNSWKVFILKQAKILRDKLQLQLQKATA